MNAVVPATQNWSAYLDLKFRSTEQKTRLIPVRRYGPLSVQRPFYPEHDLCHTYLLHPPGGVVGGDQLDLRVNAGEHAKALLTTPGATKFYQSASQTAQVKQDIQLDRSASIEFLPQENIYFPGAIVNSTTRLSVAPDSNAMLWEKHCFGRPANAENFTNGNIKTRLDIFAEEQYLFTETQRIDWQEIQRSSGMRHNPVMGTFVVVTNNLSKQLVNACREIKPIAGEVGITQLLQSMLVVRYMGGSTLQLNAYFVRLWEILRPAVLNRKACHPRIWNT
jgi:urease accessory protein